GEGYRIEFPPWGLPLIAGKQTLVRVYAVAKGTNTPVPNVPIDMSVNRADCDDNCHIGSLKPMLNATSPLNATGGLSILPAGDPAAVPAQMALDLTRSWNFLIPATWTTQDLDIIVNVNFGFGFVKECEAQFLNECERDNKVEIVLR